MLLPHLDVMALYIGLPELTKASSPLQGVSNGQLQQLMASVNATWLAALPGDVQVPGQPVLQGATCTADSTGDISFPNLVLLATAGVYNLFLTLQGYLAVCVWSQHFQQTQSGGSGNVVGCSNCWSSSDSWHSKCMRGAVHASKQ